MTQVKLSFGNFYARSRFNKVVVFYLNEKQNTPANPSQVQFLPCEFVYGDKDIVCNNAFNKINRFFKCKSITLTNSDKKQLLQFIEKCYNTKEL